MSAVARRKVVVAIDPNKEPFGPLRLGGRLARMMGAPVVLVTVFPHHPLLEGPEDEYQRSLRSEARKDLLELGRSLEGIDVADALAITGSSPARLLQHVSEGADAAVIVVGSTTRGPLRRVIPGTVAERLLSGAACPVAVAPHGYGDAEGSESEVVGVAYDTSEESARALETASALARRAGAGLRVITVHQRLAFGAVPVMASRPEDSVNRVVEQELRGAHDAAVAAASDLADVEGVFRTGSPVELLTEESRELAVLVTGSRGYGPLGAALLGSTTHDLVRSAECPLLIVPRGRALQFDDAA
jgi:nucleotide-binding universal stress UspA family protein